MDMKLKHLKQAFYYDESLFEKKDDLVFLHVGTFSGKLEKELVSRYPKCTIYCIEPHPSNYKSLLNNTEEIKSNLVYIQKALVAGEETEIKIVGEGSVCTSYQTKDSQRGISVASLNIQALCSEYDIEGIDCVFYNAEGSEMEFLPALMKSNTTDIIDQICLNFHVHVPDFGITYEKVFELLDKIEIGKIYHINDDRETTVATKATGKPLSERYPCFLFRKRF